jgi:hypothetical protein
MEGEAGYANGADSLNARTFLDGADARISFETTFIPEPSTGLLPYAGAAGGGAAPEAT